jgi:hypothetical protein
MKNNRASAALCLITAGATLVLFAGCGERGAAAAQPNPGNRYLFYLHGQIVEGAGPRPRSAEFGYYEYDKIVQTLKDQGFIVKSEIRDKNTDVKTYAAKIADEIRDLVKAGVKPGSITVVGASKGGAIAAHVSSMLAMKDLNFVILAGLFKSLLDDPTLKLYGNILSIHDKADKLPITPKPFFERSRGLGAHEQIITTLNLGHGLLYQPYPEWVVPTVKWAKGGGAKTAAGAVGD